MNDSASPQSVLKFLGKNLGADQIIESKPLLTTWAIDLAVNSSSLVNAAIGALRLCGTFMRADQWMLLCKTDGHMMALANGPGSVDSLDWSDAEAFLSKPQHIANLSDMRWFGHRPSNLAAFQSMVSVPLEILGEPPLVMLLLSHHESTFTADDNETLHTIGRMLRHISPNDQNQHKNSALAELLDADPAAKLEADNFCEISFESLRRSYAKLAEWQRAIVEITNELLAAPSRKADAAINYTLARIGDLASSDRTYVFRLRGTDRLDNTHEWTASGIKPMIAELQDMPADLMEEWLPEMDKGRAVHIPDVSALPDTSALREVLLMQAIRSLLAVPMLRNGKIVGFVGFDAVRTRRSFLNTEIQLLEAVANAISVVLDRYEKDIAVEAAQAELKAQRNRLKSTLWAIPDLVLELDQDGRFLTNIEGSKFQNKGLPSDLLGHLPEEVLPPELAALARHAMQVVDLAGELRGLEYELAVEDVPHWYSLSAAARYEQAKPCGYVFLIRDITKQVSQRRHIQRLGKISELTSNLVIVTDTEQRIEWVNPAFERRTGWKLEEIIGQRPDNLLASENTDRAEMRRIGAALRGKNQFAPNCSTRPVTARNTGLARIFSRFTEEMDKSTASSQFRRTSLK